MGKRDAVVGDQETEWPQQKYRPQDINHRTPTWREAFVDHVDPHMAVDLERIGDAEQKHRRIQVPLQLLHADRDIIEQVSHQYVVEDVDYEQQQGNGRERTDAVGKTVDHALRA
ncbi:MAG: hypothetical protein KIS75_08240 [Chromatiales bacterium]|nr:hypothetical protein [Chromatiales bacterium]